MEDSNTNLLNRFYYFCALGATGCAADLVTKHLVFAHPKLFRGSEWWLWEGHVGIQKSLNEGALFGIGQGAVWLFAAISLAALIAIPVWLFKYRAAEDFWLTTTLGCIFGGILGNFYDRMGWHGLDWGSFDRSRSGETVYAVRDWILLQWNDQWVWPNFNIADMLLVLGTVLLFIYSWKYPQEELTSDDHQRESD